MDINNVSVNKTDLAGFLVNNKEKSKLCDKSGIYEISSNDCNAVYIGEPGRLI